MELSIFLAKVIGLVSVISVLAVLARFSLYKKLEDDTAKGVSSVYLSGFVILLLGALLVTSHNIWSSDWRVVITIIGWLVLAKGILRLFFPEAVRSLVQRKRDNRWFLLGEIVMLVVGLYLLYQGFLAP